MLVTSNLSDLPAPTALGLTASFGFGDRLGLATAGHLEALKQAGEAIQGIFAQQSIRELTRTGRTPDEVMATASRALQAAAYDRQWGADADHLKTIDDIHRMAEAGFTFFTIDPSDDVDQKADRDDEKTLREKFALIQHKIDWIGDYAGKTIRVEQGPIIDFTEEIVLRAAVKYGVAILRTVEMARAIQKCAEKQGRQVDIELSVDETNDPTSAAEHFIIAHQLRRHAVKLTSLAPRFVGDFEKGVDFKGDVSAFERSLADHVAIARELGPYKIGLHSGSDKLSIYGIVARRTQGLFHVKTSGTSYLEALRVVARCAPDDFRRIVKFSRDRYDIDKATYHVSATLAGVIDPDQLKDQVDLERVYLDRWETVAEGHGFTAPGRQILHCAFGSVLTHPEFGPLIRQILTEHQDVYRDVLVQHFGRHLQALNAG